jgi:hypothetical protein
MEDCRRHLTYRAVMYSIALSPFITAAESVDFVLIGFGSHYLDYEPLVLHFLGTCLC